MHSKSRHKISLSALPRKIHTGSMGAEHSLNWDRKALSIRIKFALELICENAAEVHLEFLDEVQMGELNWQFRGKDRPTDVLSFPPHSTHGQENISGMVGSPTRQNMGEIAVCVGVCFAQAKRHRCTLANEIERMLIHGLVHLKGFDHERSDAAFSVMSALEKAIRNQLIVHLGEPDFCELIPLKAPLKKPKRVR